MFHPQGPSFFELAQQALSSTERGYDLLAEKFDYTPFRTPDEILQVCVAAIAADGPVRSGLDVCCGTGAAMQLLRPLCSDVMVGVDRSRRMLEVARQRLQDAPGSAPVEFVRGDALQMPFDGQFDLAVCFGALGHILPRDEERFAAEVHRALRPGGRFVLVTTTMPPWWSLRYLFSRAFNAAMHIRNAVIQPPFIMFYLTFLLPEAETLLERTGFDVEVRSDAFSGRYRELRLVIATKRSAEERPHG